jgi:putative aldouronate transport system substrate-binding protein
MKKKLLLCVFCALFAPLALVWSGGKNEAASSVAVPFNATGYPIVNQPLTLKVIAAKHVSTMEYNDLPIFKELEKKTGIHIEWEYAGNDWGTNKPLVLATGDLPDLFLGFGTLSQNDIIANPGMFRDLTPLIKSYGTNIKAMFRADPGMEKFSKATDGKIYGLAMKMARRPETYEVWSINQDWLTKLNLKLPTTTEEFYQVLKAFKTRDPNGNGIADEIPWSFFGPWTNNGGSFALFSAFGMNSSIANVWLTVSNGRVQYIPAQDGFKDVISFMRRLYAEGLIDQESFTNTDIGTWFARLNPTAGSPDQIGVSGFWSQDILWGTERMQRYTVMMPLKGPKGEQGWPRNTEYVQGSAYCVEIPTSSKNAEIIMRWVDALYEPLTSLQLYYGALGLVVADNGNGTYDIVLPPADSGIDNDTWIWGNAVNNIIPGYADGMTKYIRNDYLFGPQYNDKLNYVPYYKEYYPVAPMTPEEADELALLTTDITPFAEEQASHWIVDGGIEQEYDGFIRQIRGMGLDRMVAIYQGIYNRYMGK